jgi:fatty acid desaturase
MATTHTDKTALAHMDAMAAVEPKNMALLPKEEIKGHISSRSDAAGLKQLAFHLSCALISAYVIRSSRQSSGYASWVQFIVGELMLGVVASFYFNAFHECIHGTAFKTASLNKICSHVFGFAVFRGARWYWYFHWAHHRFTNNLELDPELSGSTVDRADPLAAEGWAGMRSYLLFLSGFPFGFERIPGIFNHAQGKPPTEAEKTFVKTDKARLAIKEEYSAWVMIYGLLLLSSAVYPSIGVALWYYWLLPHMIGASHLRYYQVIGSYRLLCLNSRSFVLARIKTTYSLRHHH